jgi:hypothetical protein
MIVIAVEITSWVYRVNRKEYGAALDTTITIMLLLLPFMDIAND